MVHIQRAWLTLAKNSTCEDRLLLLCDGKPRPSHAPATKKLHKQIIKKKNIENAARCGITERQKVERRGGDDSIGQFSIRLHPACLTKDMWGGVVYWAVLCCRPCLVSVLFAGLLSLHLVAFLMVFILVYICLTRGVIHYATLIRTEVIGEWKGSSWS